MTQTEMGDQTERTRTAEEEQEPREEHYELVKKYFTRDVMRAIEKRKRAEEIAVDMAKKEQATYDFMESQGKRIMKVGQLETGETYVAIFGVDGYRVFEMPGLSDIARGIRLIDIYTDYLEVASMSNNGHGARRLVRNGRIHLDDISFEKMGVFHLENESSVKRNLEISLREAKKDNS